MTKNKTKPWKRFTALALAAVTIATCVLQNTAYAIPTTGNWTGSIPTQAVTLGDEKTTTLEKAVSDVDISATTLFGGAHDTVAVYIQKLSGSSNYYAYCGNPGLHMYTGSELYADSSTATGTTYYNTYVDNIIKAAIYYSYYSWYDTSSNSYVGDTERRIISQFLIWRIIYLYKQGLADTIDEIQNNFWDDDLRLTLREVVEAAGADADASGAAWYELSRGSSSTSFLGNAANGYFGEDVNRISMSDSYLVRWAMTDGTSGSTFQYLFTISKSVTTAPSTSSYTAYLQIYKSGANKGSSAKVSGCVYTVYSNSSCTSSLGTLTIGSDGYSNKLSVALGDRSASDPALTKTVYIKETSAASGTSLDSTVYSVTLSESNTSSSPYVKSLTNNEWSGTVSLKKYDSASGSGVSGATFTLYQYNGSSYSKVGTFTDNGSGSYSYSSTLYYTSTNQGKFRIVETSAPTGYTLPTAASGDFSYSSSIGYYKDFTLTATGQTFSYTAYDSSYSGTVSLTKYDSVSSAYVTGATFTLYQYNGSSYSKVGTFTDNGDGTYTYPSTIYYTSTNKGKFRIIETSLPSGYETYSGSNGDFTYSSSIGYYKDFTLTAVGQSFTYNAYDVPYSGTVSLTKYDSVTGAKVTGATFTLYQYNGSSYSKVGTFTDNGDGTYTYPSTIYYTQKNQGKYRIVETGAPTGYNLPTAASGDFSYSSSIGYYKNFTLTATGQTFSYDAYDEPWSATVDLTKYDSVSGAKVYGATFTLYQYNGSSYTKLGTFTDNGDGTYTYPDTIYYSQTNQGKFRIIETGLPDGYDTYSGSNGDFKYSSSIGYYKDFTITKNGQTFSYNAYDEPWSATVGLTKYDSVSSAQVYDATFTLYQYNKTSKSYVKVGTFTDNGDGTYTYPNTIYYTQTNLGKYRIIETGLPDGYETYTGNSGDFTYDSSIGYYKDFTLTAGGQSFNFDANDRPWNGIATVTKADSETGGVIAGAEFTLYTWSKSANSYVKTKTLTDNGDGTYTTGTLYYSQDNLGKFKIVETDSPYGYLMDGFTQEFTITYDGQTFSYTATDTPVKVNIDGIKEDSETGSTPQGDASLEGAVYGVYAAETIHAWSVEATVLYEKDELVTTATTDSTGAFSFTDLPLGNYYVKEITASEGYWLDENSYNCYGRDKYDDMLDAGDTITLRVTVDATSLEEVLKLPIEIIKFTYSEGDGGIASPVEGAIFTVKLASEVESVGWDSATTYDVITTDAGGYAKTIDLPYGTYIIRETYTPTNMISVDDFTVTIDFAAYYDKDGGPLRYYLYDQEFSAWIKIVKMDVETGKTVLLEGATFKIMNVATGEYVSMKVGTDKYQDTFVTDENGYISTPQMLEPGNYKLVEIHAPYGYVLNDDFVFFTVGSVFTDELDADSEPVIIVRMSDVSQKGTITITKTGEVLKATETTVDANGTTTTEFTYSEEGLAGAVYGIYAAEDIYSADNQGDLVYAAGTLVTTVTTGTDGTGTSVQLPLGSYTVKEITAPYGYVHNDEAHNVTLTYAGENVFVTEESTSYVNDRQKVELLVTKQDADGTLTKDDYLAGAVFGIYAAEDITAWDGTVLISAGTLLETLTTGEDGKATAVSDYPLSFSYEVRELQAPSGYASTDDTVTLSAVYQGQDVVTASFTAEFKNQIIKLSVSKTDITTGEDIDGATLSIVTKQDIVWNGTKYAAGDTVVTWTTRIDSTSGSSAYRIEGLPIGDYTLVEEQAPTWNGYVKSDSVDFTLTDTGVLQQVEMKDDYTKVQIKKTDITTGEEIDGATLSIITNEDITWQGVEYSAGDTIVTWTTKSGETYEFDYLPVGEYTLVEEQAPTWSGYVKADDITFTVLETGKIQMVEMQDDYTKVQIKKTDITTGEEIDGATLSIITNEDITWQGVEYSAGDTIVTWTTKSGETYEFDYLPIGEYTLVEEQAPTWSGYVKANDITFTVLETGEIQQVEMKDDYTKVQIKKTDITTGKEIDGATLSIVTKENITWQGVEYSAGDTIVTWTTTAGEIVEFDYLPVGEYILVEEQAPTWNGYVKADDVAFTVLETGEIQLVQMEDDHTKVQLIKTDIATGEEIDGAILSIITNQDIVWHGEAFETGDIIVTWTSDSSRTFLFEYLPVGDYTLVEDLAPTWNGYVKADDMVFTVLETGEIQQVEMKDDYTKVQIKKTDITTGEEIDGTTLSIITNQDIIWQGVEYSAGDTIVTWTTVAGETFEFDYLPIGEYTLVEEQAPTWSGYVKADDITFTVLETGEIQRIEMKDDYTKVQIKKTDITTGEEIDGATLSIITNQDIIWQGVEYSAGDTIVTWTTVAGETFEFDYLPIGDYTLVEEQPPTWSGYVKADDITFTVLETGEIQLVEMKDDYTKVQIRKTDITTGEEIDGATLSIVTNQDIIWQGVEYSAGDTIVTWTTVAGETYEFDYLPVGEYTLVEEQAPTWNGYVKAVDAVFTVDETGMIQLVEMQDDYTKVQIKKTDITTGEEIDGATLSIVTNQDITWNGVDYEAGDTIVTWTTESGENYEFDYLPVGEYTLVEEQAPTEQGYVVADSITFTVDESGVIHLVEMKDDYTKVAIYKEDAVTGAYLDGALFLLSDGTTEVLFVSSADGSNFTYLPEGTYTVTELVAPSGYTLAESFTVEIYGSDEIVITVADERQTGIWELTKTDESTGEALAGATFVLTRTDADGNTIEVGSYTTDASGRITVTGLDIGTYDENGVLTCLYTYAFHETGAPSGYVLDSTETTFAFTASDDMTAYGYSAGEVLADSRAVDTDADATATDAEEAETVSNDVEGTMDDLAAQGIALSTQDANAVSFTVTNKEKPKTPSTPSTPVVTSDTEAAAAFAALALAAGGAALFLVKKKEETEE